MHKTGEMYDVLWLTKGERVGCTSLPVNVGEAIKIVGHEEPFKVLHVDHETKDYFVYQPEFCDCPHVSECHEPRQRVQIEARKRIEGLTVKDCDFYKTIEETWLFTKKDFAVIDTAYNGDFEFIYCTNIDGSLRIDVFELYKESDEVFIVKEKGEIRLQASLQECLQFIHKWL